MTTTKKRTAGNGRAGVDPALLSDVMPEGERKFVLLEALYAKSVGVVEARIEGDAPLLYHPMTEKAQTEMEAKVQGKAKLGRAARQFDEDYLNCLRWMALKKPGPKTIEAVPKFEYGIDALCFKNAMIDSGKMHDQDKNLMRRIVFVRGVAVPGGELVRIEGEVEMDRRPARNKGGGFDIRVRPIFQKWAAQLTIRYQAKFCEGEAVIQWLLTCGECCGVGDFRPNGHQSTGNLGTWKVVEASYIPPAK